MKNPVPVNPDLRILFQNLPIIIHRQYVMAVSYTHLDVYKRQAQVYREYQAALRRNNALDFDDLICKTVEPVSYTHLGDVPQLG